MCAIPLLTHLIYLLYSCQMEFIMDEYYPFGHTTLLDFRRNYLKSHKVMATSLPPSILQQNDSNRWNCY